MDKIVFKRACMVICKNSLSLFIVSMTKLLDAEAYNYFNNCTAVQLLILPNKQNGGKPLKHEGNCSPEELKAKELTNN